MNLEDVITWYVMHERSDPLFRFPKVLGNESVIRREKSNADEGEGYIYP